MYTVSVHNNKHDYAVPKQSQGLAHYAEYFLLQDWKWRLRRQKQD